jgi:hypothetical protein
VLASLFFSFYPFAFVDESIIEFCGIDQGINLSRPSCMPIHAKKFLPPFDWTQLDPGIQTEILRYTTRRFVTEWTHENHRQTLCFERPIHPKLLEPTQLTITCTDKDGPREWTNVFKISCFVINTFQGEANQTSGWWFQFHILQKCANKPGTTQEHIYATYIVGNFTREALIRGLTESLQLRHQVLKYGQDEFSI